MFATDRQLDDVLEEGLENRWQRHSMLRDLSHEWVRKKRL